MRDIRGDFKSKKKVQMAMEDGLFCVCGQRHLKEGKQFWGQGAPVYPPYIENTQKYFIRHYLVALGRA